jgi:hypothetical protein
MSNTPLDDEKIKVIDIIIDMYPELKKNREDIIFNVFEKQNKTNKYIFTKTIINNISLYIDPYGLILDKDLKFYGFYIDEKYYLENDNIDNIELIDIEKYNKIIFN